MATVKLELSHRKYESLHALADGRGKETCIKKELLRSLLIDLSRLYNSASYHGAEIIEETAK